MKTPHVLANGISTGYGLGLFVERHRGVEMIYHPGGTLSGNAQMLKVSHAGLDVVVLMNRADVFGTELTQRIMAACIKGLDLAKPSPSHEIIRGTFRSPATGRVIQLFEREGQQIVSIDAGNRPAQLDENGILRPGGALQHFKWTVTPLGDSSNLQSIRFNDFGNVDELVRVNSVDEPDLSKLTGHYHSDAIRTDAWITRTATGLQMRTVGSLGAVIHQLDCLAHDIWRSKSPEGDVYPCGILSFEPGHSGFRFSTISNAAMMFRRATEPVSL